MNAASRVMTMCFEKFMNPIKRPQVKIKKAKKFFAWID
jgi:hypothetical protein